MTVKWILGRQISGFLFSAFVFLIAATSASAAMNVGGRISSNTTWIKAKSPYTVTSTIQVYGSMTVPVTLTIEAGVQVRFKPGTALQIGSGPNQGALVAKGTAATPITFTRYGTSGTWGKLDFQDGTVDSTTVLERVNVQYNSGANLTSASPTFRYCTFSNIADPNQLLNLNTSNPILENVALSGNSTYGIYLSNASPQITGGSLTNTNPAGHGIYGSGSPVISGYSVSIVNTAGKYGLYLSSTTSALSVTNSTIGNGLFLSPANISPTVTGNTFTNSDSSPLHIGANIVGQVLNANTFNGMTSAGKIEVVAEQIKQDVLWKKWPAPYALLGSVSVYKDTTAAATLTIDPGVEIRFDSGAGLQIGSGANQGALVAKGTATSPITFTRNGTSGTWGKLDFQNGTVDSTTVLEYVNVRYNSGNSVSSASPTLRNCSLLDIADPNYGIYLSTSNPVLENVDISGNSTYGIYLSGSSPRISGGRLTNAKSGGYGIYGDGSPEISGHSVSIVNSAGIYGLYLSSTTAALSVTNSTIGNGLYLASTNFTPTITGNTFTNSDSSPLHIGANMVGQVLNANTFNGMLPPGRSRLLLNRSNRMLSGKSGRRRMFCLAPFPSTRIRPRQPH